MRVNNRLKVLFPVLVGFVLLLGCTEDEPEAFLVVDVTTARTPAVDFDTVTLDIFEGTSDEGARPFDPISRTVRAEDSFVPSFRFLDDGAQRIKPGMYLAEMTMSNGALRVDSRRRMFEVVGTTGIAFNFGMGPACTSGAQCESLLDASCSAVACVAQVCVCTCGSSTDAGCDAIEICSNGADDDGDGDIDCVDSDCDGRACDDGDLCTVGDVCGSQLCNAQPKDCATADVCKVGSCNPVDGSCEVSNRPDGTLCSAHPNRCCNGGCVDLSSDANNCGSCGVACATGRCDNLGNGRAACWCGGFNSNCTPGTVCYDPDGTGTHPDAFRCDCQETVGCGSGATCATVAGAIDHCFYE